MTRLRRTLTAIVLALAVLPLGAAAHPADTSDTADETEAKVKILRLLNADSVEKQQRAVRLIGYYAHTDRYDDDFFRLMVTPLHYVVAEGQTESLRIMAISALYSIGTDAAMEGLRAQVNTLDTGRVKEFTQIALAQYKADRITAAK
jgi:hypothetical protein